MLMTRPDMHCGLREKSTPTLLLADSHDHLGKEQFEGADSVCVKSGVALSIQVFATLQAWGPT